jgi:glutathione S-transferase
VKLYTYMMAPSPRRVRVFAAEKGIEYEAVEINLRAGEQFSDSYELVNPDCVVPALETDDGEVITEVNAICAYLEELQPEPTLYGATPVERARALEWNAKVEQQGLLAMAEAFRNSVGGLKGRAVTGPVGYDQIPALAERGAKRVGVFLARLDERLADHEFLAGERYTVADIAALCFVDFAVRAGVASPEGHAHLVRWHDAVSARPSAGA